MTTQSYSQFCPVAMAAEILGGRWTLVLLREFYAGSTRFNDLRRGVPRMSPALLSKRLKELEDHGVIQRRLVRKHPETYEYHLTEAGEGLKPVIESIGIWGQRWVESEPSLDKLDPGLLMWDMRRNIRVDLMPPRRVTVEFIFPDQPVKYWMICDPNAGVDLCSVDPGFDVDLFVNASLRTMTAIWMGLETVRHARDAGGLDIVGDADVASGMQDWLGLSPFAPEKKRVP